MGAGLALSGAAMQGLFRNPLADPSIVGVTSGGLDEQKEVTYVPMIWRSFRLQKKVGSTLAAESQPRALSHWASKISSSKDLKGRVGRRLAERGVLHVQQDKFLFLFTRTNYPERDPGPERELRSRLRQAVMGSSQDLDTRTVALLSIAKATGLLRTILDKQELEQRKQHIERIIEGEATGKVARELIKQVEAMVLLTVIT